MSKFCAMMVDMAAIGQRLKRFRDSLGYSQEGLALSVGMKQTTWGSWERNPPDSLEWLTRVARRYNVSADYLLDLVDAPMGRRELSAEEEQLLALWHELDNEQRQYVLDTLAKLQRWSQPRIIGGTVSLTCGGRA